MKRKPTRKRRPALDRLPEILDVNDLSDYLDIPPSTVRTLAREGRIPSFKIGRRRKFQREAVRRWLEAQNEPSSPSD